MAITMMSKPSLGANSRVAFRAQKQRGQRRLPVALAFPNLLGGKSSNGTGAVEMIKDEIMKDIKYRESTGAGSDKAETTYSATAWSVHNRLVDSFNQTHAHWKKKDPKFVYYLSAEFLMGRTMTNAIYNLGLEGEYADAVRALGTDLETVTSTEIDAALGNGGLGRLASCFLDSMASLDLPGWGYGIRYRYGMFKQGISADGKQIESPDKWIPGTGNPWEIRRPETRFPVGFYGSVGADGTWTPEENVHAVACDVPIPGYRTTTTSNLRLWDCEPMEEFDLEAFNAGEYEKAVLNKRKADEIVAVLYPNDATAEGKELRLKQQYFFVAASLQDTLARFLETQSDFEKLPEKACFQMNDTHPTIAVPELMRLLIDVHGLEFNKAWEITKKSLAYTNHTVMPEALEKWPVAVLQKLLPRHMQLIEQINDTWLASIKGHVEKKVAAAAAAAKPTDPAEVSTEDSAEEAEEEAVDPVAEALEAYSIIQSNPWNKSEKLINMAYLAVVGSFAVNGVAAIHSEIIKEDIFPQFVEIFPEKFQNKTNGVTLRRWLAYCNPELAALITEALGTEDWIRDATLLAKLKPMADDAAFRKKWMAVKLKRKEKLAAHIKASTGYDVPVASMFDVQVKRIHEYKRQLMNAVSLIHRYQTIKAASPEERAKMVPRVTILGGKAASAYYMAKKIVALINAISKTVNNDPEVGDLLKVIFLPNYNVTEAEVIIPAAELSQHISTAGTEASGTSNMKFALNGSTIIGTMDGANIEIAENTGEENLFIFGVDAADVPRLREERTSMNRDDYDPRWNAAWDAVREGVFGDKEYFQNLVESVNDVHLGKGEFADNNDWFLCANDFASYMRAQDEADALYADQDAWTKRWVLISTDVRSLIVRPATLSLALRSSLVRQVDHLHGEQRVLLERPHNHAVRERDLERQTVEAVREQTLRFFCVPHAYLLFVIVIIMMLLAHVLPYTTLGRPSPGPPGPLTPGRHRPASRPASSCRPAIPRRPAFRPFRPVWKTPLSPRRSISRGSAR